MSQARLNRVYLHQLWFSCTVPGQDCQPLPTPLQACPHTGQACRGPNLGPKYTSLFLSISFPTSCISSFMHTA